VRLDASGLCNYCRHWDATKGDVLDFERNRPLLIDRLTRYRGRFHYDAAVGLSGGKDSTYVLHRLSSEYDANVLGITFDNGFLTDYAWRNVRGIGGATGVERFVYKPNWAAYREFYRASLRKLGDPCVACSIGGYITSVRGCRDLRIPFFVHGRSPMQMLRHWYPGTRDLGIGILKSNLARHDPSLLRRQYGWVIRRIRLLLLYLIPNPRVRRRILDELVSGGLSRGDLVPEFLGFFLFEPYDERAIVDYLEALDLTYQRPENHAILGHSDCLIHDAAGFLYERRHGIERILPDLAAMLRQGAIEVDEADRILEDNRPSEEALEASIGHLIERLEMSRGEFDGIVARLSRKAGERASR
jgi:hypothetical protein